MKSVDGRSSRQRDCVPSGELAEVGHRPDDLSTHNPTEYSIDSGPFEEDDMHLVLDGETLGHASCVNDRVGSVIQKGKLLLAHGCHLLRYYSGKCDNAYLGLTSKFPPRYLRNTALPRNCGYLVSSGRNQPTGIASSHIPITISRITAPPMSGSNALRSSGGINV